MTPRAPDPWIDDEPRLGALFQQVGSRALRRPLQLFGLALLVTGLFVAQRVRRAPSYEATAYFRMIEGDVAADAYAAPAPRAIREYVQAVALNTKKLLEIMDAHGISKGLRARDPHAAVESMRDDIEIGVSRNYFIYDRRPDDEPRSASVGISYSSTNRELAGAIVHELGQAVLDIQARQRNDRLNAERTLNDAELGRAQGNVRQVQRELDFLRVDGAGARGTAFITNQAEVANAQERLKMALVRGRTLEKRDADLDLAADVEDQRLGLAFQLVDEDVVVRDPTLGTAQLVRLALSLFLCVGAVTLVVVGGWGRRVDAPEDLAAAGLPILGRVERFPGDDVGSYRARTAAATATASATAKGRGKPGILGN